jgi:hypothetical protein
MSRLTLLGRSEVPEEGLGFQSDSHLAKTQTAHAEGYRSTYDYDYDYDYEEIEIFSSCTVLQQYRRTVPLPPPHIYPTADAPYVTASACSDLERPSQPPAPTRPLAELAFLFADPTILAASLLSSSIQDFPLLTSSPSLIANTTPDDVAIDLLLSLLSDVV